MSLFPSQSLYLRQWFAELFLLASLSTTIPPKQLAKHPAELASLNLLRGCDCSDSSARTKMPRTSLTQPMQSLLTFSPASLSTRVAQKPHTALTAAAPGMFTSSHSHSTRMNLTCLVMDLPFDFSFNH